MCKNLQRRNDDALLKTLPLKVQVAKVFFCEENFLPLRDLLRGGSVGRSRPSTPIKSFMSARLRVESCINLMFSDEKSTAITPVMLAGFIFPPSVRKHNDGGYLSTQGRGFLAS